MSISSLAETSILQQDPDLFRKTIHPRAIEFARSAAQPQDDQSALLDELAKNFVSATDLNAELKTKAKTALDSLAEYIPTEIITLYIAACSAMEALKQVIPVANELRVYWLFVVLTPAVFLLVLAGKRRALDLSPLPKPFSALPWWEIAAATIAFMVWALAVPNSPLPHGIAEGTLAALGAIFVSMFLSLLSPIFGRRSVSTPA